MTNVVPGVKGFVALPLEERFWAKVDQRGPDECWEWQGSCDTNGYGLIWRDRQNWKTHRLAWELANGPIPEGLHCLHRCDNPPCVNVAHLFLGTPLDNAQDRNAKGRTRNGVS